MYKVWLYYEVDQYDKQSMTHGLFTGYILSFQGLKKEASGWPKWPNTVELGEQYVKEYYDRKVVRLNPEKNEYNSGLIGLEKLKWNNLWGKFAMCENFPKVQYVTDTFTFLAS